MITRIRMAPHIGPKNPMDYNNKVILIHSTPVDGMLIDQNYLDFGSSVRVNPTTRKKFIIVEELLHPFEHTHWLVLHNHQLRVLATDTKNLFNGTQYTHVPIADHDALTPPRWMAQNYLKILFELPERIYDECYLEAISALEAEHRRNPTQELAYAASLHDMELLDRRCREAEAIARPKPQFLKYMLADILNLSLGHPGSQASKQSDVLERAHLGRSFKWEDIQSLFASKVDVDLQELLSSKKIEEAISNSSNLDDLFSVEYRRGIKGQKTGNLVNQLLMLGVGSCVEFELKVDSAKNKLYITRMKQSITSDGTEVSLHKLLDTDGLLSVLHEYIESTWKVALKDIQALSLHKHGPILIFNVKVEGAEYKYAIQMLDLLQSIPLFHTPYLND